MSSASDAHTVRCPLCGDEVPAGAFCGACGGHLRQGEHSGRAGLRSHAYAAAPGEHVLALSVVSSLFPHLPHRSRAPFRVGVAVVVVALAVLAVLRWQAPLIAVCALGLPVLFVLYLQESDVYEGLPLLPLIGAAVLGGALGYGWSALTAEHVARALGESLLAGRTPKDTLLNGVLLPLAAAALIVAPGVAMRLASRGAGGESMDGYLVGAVGAVAFAGASTLTRLAPQLRTGVVAHGRPVSSLLDEALLQGVAVPLTAAAVGGAVGAAVWLRRRDPVHGARWLASPLTALAAAGVLYVALGLLDVWQPSAAAVVALHLLGAAGALLAMRFGVQAVLLHEEHAVRIGAPAVCPHCEQVAPQMPFCPLCGVAARISSRRHRRALQVAAAGELS